MHDPFNCELVFAILYQYTIIVSVAFCRRGNVPEKPVLNSIEDSFPGIFYERFDFLVFDVLAARLNPVWWQWWHAKAVRTVFRPTIITILHDNSLIYSWSRSQVWIESWTEQFDSFYSLRVIFNQGNSSTGIAVIHLRICPRSQKP